MCAFPAKHQRTLLIGHPHYSYFRISTANTNQNARVTLQKKYKRMISYGVPCKSISFTLPLTKQNSKDFNSTKSRR